MIRTEPHEGASGERMRISRALWISVDTDLIFSQVDGELVVLTRLSAISGGCANRNDRLVDVAILAWATGGNIRSRTDRAKQAFYAHPVAKTDCARTERDVQPAAGVHYVVRQARVGFEEDASISWIDDPARVEARSQGNVQWVHQRCGIRAGERRGSAAATIGIVRAQMVEVPANQEGAQGTIGCGTDDGSVAAGLESRESGLIAGQQDNAGALRQIARPAGWEAHLERKNGFVFAGRVATDHPCVDEIQSGRQLPEGCSGLVEARYRVAGGLIAVIRARQQQVGGYGRA